MKKIVIALAALMAGAGSAAAQEVTLRVHHFLPATSNQQIEVLEPFKAGVEKQSNGRIKVDIYPSMQLGGKPPQLFDQARDGIVDVSWTLLGYTPGRFPAAEVFELPFMSSTAAATTAALQKYQAKYLGKELGSVHVLLLHAPAGYKFHMTKKEVAKLDDLKGLKIRAPSRAMTEGLNALGATAVGMPVPEVAQALATGVIDGAVLPWEVVGSLRIEEIVKSHTEIGVANGGLANSVMAFVMNKAKYDGLPADLKKVIDDNSGAALAKIVGPAFDRTEERDRKAFADKGAKIIIVPETDVPAWKSATQPVIDNWVKTMSGKGYPAQEMVDDARKWLAEAGK